MEKFPFITNDKLQVAVMSRNSMVHLHECFSFATSELLSVKIRVGVLHAKILLANIDFGSYRPSADCYTCTTVLYKLTQFECAYTTHINMQCHVRGFCAHIFRMRTHRNKQIRPDCTDLWWQTQMPARRTKSCLVLSCLVLSEAVRLKHQT